QRGGAAQRAERRWRGAGGRGRALPAGGVDGRHRHRPHRARRRRAPSRLEGPPALRRQPGPCGEDPGRRSQDALQQVEVLPPRRPVTRTALSVRAGELVRAAQALPTAKSADTLYEMIAAGAATLRPGVVTTLRLVDGDGVRLVAVAPSQASVSELDADHARRVLNAASRLLIRGKRAGEGSYYGLLLADTDGALGVLGLSLPPGTTVLPGIERQLLDMYATQASLALRHSVLAATVERQTATLEVAKGELVEA